MGRGAKAGITLLVIGVVLAGGLVVADRIAVGAAERRIAQQAAKELVARDITTSGDPKVVIEGFPFLTQVMAGSYDKITIKLPAPKASGVQFDGIDLTVLSVAADTRAVLNGTGTVTARRVTGTARLGWDAVRDALEVVGLPGVDASAVSVTVVDNAVTVRMPVAASGQQGVLVASGELQVQDGTVKLRLSKVTADGAVNAFTQRIIDQYRNRLVISLKVPDMPYRLVINRVTTTDTGVSIVASAENVVLAG